MFIRINKIKCYFPFYYSISVTFLIYPGESGNYTGKRLVITLVKPHWRRELPPTLIFPGKNLTREGSQKLDHKLICNPTR